MTIIAGFKSYQGIVLCADTQETVEHAKRHVPKLQFRAQSNDGNEKDPFSNLASAFCGAGEGPFIDKLVEESWKHAKGAKCLDDACEEIEKSIKRQYREFGRIYQRGLCPEVQIIFGVKMDGQTRLFDAAGPIVNERSGYDSGGIGHYMADFLAQRMYRDYLNLHQCVILAAYVLFQAKEHVEGCGGDSQIAVLREEGASGIVDWKRIGAITKLLNFTDNELGQLLLDSPNLELADDELKKRFALATGLLETLRDNQRQDVESGDAVLRILSGNVTRDHFGLPTQSDSQGSEPER